MNSKIRASLFLLALMFLMHSGCIVRIPPPPTQFVPLDTFKYSFTPAGQKYEPTSTKPVKRFKNTYTFKGQPTKVISEETPSQPYIAIGKLQFVSNWYDDKTIQELIDLHVPEVGGDAVLLYEMLQQGAAIMKSPETGKFRNMYYGSINLEVIRYTDR